MRFDFSNPDYLYFLFAIPFIILFYFYSTKRVTGNSIKFANFDAIARIKGIDIYSKNISVFLLDLLLVVFIVFSLSGLNVHLDKQGSLYSYVIAIDSSESMGASDIMPNRFEVAKENAIEFVNMLPLNSNVGIISFSSNSLIEQDLTSNKNILFDKINNTQLTGIGGTDIFEVISLSILLLKNEDNKKLIILSDGQVNMGDVDLAIKNAIDNDLVVNTLGIGTDIGGNTNFGVSIMDESTLKLIANKTGGRYFRANDFNEIRNSFNSLIEVGNKSVKFQLTMYLLIISIILFILREFIVYFSKVVI